MISAQALARGRTNFPMTPMKRFIADVAVLGVVVMVGLVIAIPALGELVFSNMLPERWLFRHWPIWFEIPFGIVIDLYVLLDAWWTIRSPGKKGGTTC